MIGSLYHGWVVVGAAALILFMAYGTQYAFGVFFAALLDEFAWSRASLSGAFSLYAFNYGAFGLVCGHLTDRLGPRMVIAGGAAFLGLGLMSMSQLTELWHTYFLYGVVAALGMSTAYVPCTVTVARWFVRRRGLAVGIASAGGSLGIFALPPVAHLLVSSLGWRWAYLAFGASILALLNVLAMVMRRDPESMGLKPDGGALREPPRFPAGSEDGWTVGQAARTFQFWMLSGIFSATWIPVFIPLVHLVPLARDLGISPVLASTLLSALGIAAVGGRLVLGGLSDRIGRRAALGLALLLQAAAFLGFSVAASLPSLYGVAAAFGFSYGAISTLFPALVSDFFGRAHAGSVVGVLFAISASMAAWGPLAAGWIFDTYGDYGPAWLWSAGLNALALALLRIARPPGERRRFAATPPDTAPIA